MMNGIEVLSERSISIGDSNVIFSVFSFCVLLGLFIFLMILVTESYGIKLLGVSSCAIVTIMSMIVLFAFFCSPSDNKEYQVTISDDVKMQEFNAKYDIIKVEGKIYTIREKEGK